MSRVSIDFWKHYKAITEENRYAEVSTGAEQGREAIDWNRPPELATLLSRVSKENLPDKADTDWGKREGSEAW